MKTKMQRWRRNTRPPAPRNWLHYVTLLAMATWATFTQYEGGQLHVSMIRAVDNTIAIVYTDQALLDQIQAQTLCFYATFQVVPLKPKSYQLLTIMAEVNHAVSIQIETMIFSCPFMSEPTHLRNLNFHRYEDSISRFRGLQSYICFTIYLF